MSDQRAEQNSAFGNHLLDWLDQHIALAFGLLIAILAILSYVIGLAPS
jgi:hypothetical protein